MKSLLDEIEADYHNDLLERGNLRKRREIRASFTPSWTSQGYVCRLLESTCRCGAKSLSLMGIFHRETTTAGGSRDQIMDLKGFALPPDSPCWTEITPVLTAACADCIHPRFLENVK